MNELKDHFEGRMEDLSGHLDGRIEGLKGHFEEQLASNNLKMEGRMDGLETAVGDIENKITTAQ